LLLEEGTRPDQVLKRLVSTPGVVVQRFERVEASLDEIFVKVVERDLTEEEVRA
jgi:hypothetical protein